MGMDGCTYLLYPVLVNLIQKLPTICLHLNGEIKVSIIKYLKLIERLVNF